MKMFSITCGSCGASVSVPEKARGMRVHCLVCKQQIVVPNSPPPDEPPKDVDPPHQEPPETAEIERIIEPERRFPAWVIPSLAAINVVFLILLIIAVSLSDPTSTTNAPRITNKKTQKSRISPATRNRSRTKKTGTTGQVLSVEDIYKRCAPATVSIVTADSNSEHLGSGFFVSSDGYVLTNHHVVENARRVHIFTESGTYMSAKIIDSWKAIDLALLKVSGTNHAMIPLADSDNVEIGSSVVAIGTPQDLGLAQSITQGIVSGRRLFGNIPCYQTSTLINHGNSGGPLINMKGQVIGIATFVMGTAVVTPQGNIGSDIQGINFAVEINLAKDLLKRNRIAIK